MNTGGILDALLDPKVMDEITARQTLVATLVDRWGCDVDAARAWLISEDQAAKELFAIGNKMPREILH